MREPARSLCRGWLALGGGAGTRHGVRRVFSGSRHRWAACLTLYIGRTPCEGLNAWVCVFAMRSSGDWLRLPDKPRMPIMPPNRHGHRDSLTIQPLTKVWARVSELIELIHRAQSRCARCRNLRIDAEAVSHQRVIDGSRSLSHQRDTETSPLVAYVKCTFSLGTMSRTQQAIVDSVWTRIQSVSTKVVVAVRSTRFSSQVAVLNVDKKRLVGQAMWQAVPR